MVRRNQTSESEASGKEAFEPNLLAGQMLTAQELAAYLRVNRSTVYRLLKKKQLPGFRIGSEWRFQIEEVNRWFRERGPGDL
ncbi:MAG TPA: helix-turn-helix domain-containing protein [Candidatus Binataceae bacterium]|nr:helix-turn-helix domain-containing protein [Candidatus Binataceae bacterium]